MNKPDRLQISVEALYLLPLQPLARRFGAGFRGLPEGRFHPSREMLPMGMVPWTISLGRKPKGHPVLKAALLILASLLLYGRLVFVLVFVNQRSRRIYLLPTSGSVVILSRQILAGSNGAAVPQFPLDGVKISTDTILK
jgi:hypothetical protein